MLFLATSCFTRGLSTFLHDSYPIDRDELEEDRNTFPRIEKKNTEEERFPKKQRISLENGQVSR